MDDVGSDAPYLNNKAKGKNHLLVLQLGGIGNRVYLRQYGVKSLCCLYTVWLKGWEVLF